MARVSMTIPQFQRFLAALSPRIEAAIVRGLRSGGMWMKRTVVLEIGTAQPFPAVDRGALRNSVVYRPVSDGSVVSVDAPHAAIIEHGTRPFWPPLAPLVAWVRRKGFADARGAYAIARAVQRKIARDGIAPRHYFSKAWRRAVPMVEAEIAQELARLRVGQVRGGRSRVTLPAVGTGRSGSGRGGR
jgi:hypothetical protein